MGCGLWRKLLDGAHSSSERALHLILIYFGSPLIHIFRWFAAAGDVKLLQALLVQGQGWARGYAAAAVVECIKALSQVSATGGGSSSGVSDTTKDVAAILSAMFEVLIDEKVLNRLHPALLPPIHLLKLLSP